MAAGAPDDGSEESVDEWEAAEEAPGPVGQGTFGDAFDQPRVRVTDEPGEAGTDEAAVQPVVPGQTATPAAPPSSTELPHWTEPPTGEVPAVLARGPESERQGSGIIPPSWREEDADWVAHEEEFEPSMFGERARCRSAPWTRPIGPRNGGRGSSTSTRSRPARRRRSGLPRTPARRPRRSPASRQRVPSSPSVRRRTDGAGTSRRGSEWAGTGARVGRRSRRGRPTDELFESGARPSGTKRSGRARRSVLRPGRMRAKRPDDVDVAEAPLAAEPPGAAVTEVPGAGRKRVGLAGLAAADRTAETRGGAGSREAEAAVPATAAETDVAAAGAAAADRRPHGAEAGEPTPHWSPEPEAPAGTGGGPPPPRRSRRPARGGRRARRSSRPAGSALRIGTGIAVAVVAVIAFELGTVTSLVLCVVVVTFAAGECFGVLRRAGYHPATLLGLVGTISLMVGAYTKGVAALPLILVLITVFTLLWYVFGIEQGSPVAGTAATLFTVGWVSLLGSYAGLLLAPSLFPNRHGIAFLVGAIDRHRGERRGRARGRALDRPTAARARRSARTRPGRA